MLVLDRLVLVLVLEELPRGIRAAVIEYEYHFVEYEYEGIGLFVRGNL